MRLFIFVLVVSCLTFDPMASPAMGFSNTEDERESRLLFSPMSPKARERLSADIQSLLQRKPNREGHHVAAESSGRSSETAAASAAELHRREDREPSMKELCHAKALHKCGSAVISGFELPNLTAEQKCRIRENFLHCMIKNKFPRCRVHRGHPHVTEETVQSIRQQIVQLLWTARGCVIGLESI